MGRAGLKMNDMNKKHEEERRMLAREKEEAVTKMKTAEATLSELRGRLEKLEQERRTETERMKALNIKASSEMKKFQQTGTEIIELRSQLARAEVKRDKEKFQAEKSAELVAKLENIIKDSQEDRAIKEQRCKELENRNLVA